MTNILKIICISWMFWRICKTKESIDDLTNLAISVQKLYSSPSIIVVYDRHIYGFEKEVKLINIIKSYSRHDRLSQAISFDDFGVKFKRHESALYVLEIGNKEDLEISINVTKNTDISYHPWLLVFSSSDFNCNAPGKDFFKLRMDTKMTAKCKGDNVLKKYYSIFNNQTEIVDLAVWTSEKKFKFKDEKSLINMQTDMKGVTLRVANKTSSWSGQMKFNVDQFCNDLIEELKNVCHFEIQQGPQDDGHGFLNSKNQQWNGIIGILIKNDADIGADLISMSHNRIEVVDYVTPLARGHCYLYAKLPKHAEVPWDAYFQIFDRKATIVTYLSTLIFTVFIFLMSRRICKRSFSENFINVWGILTQQGLTDQTSSNSIQIVYVSILTWSLILNTIYSACIISYITALSPKLPFNTYEEFQRDNIYKVAVLKNSKDYDRIMSNDSMLSPLKHRLKRKCSLPINYYQGFQQACEENTAFFSNEVKYEDMKYNLPCELGSVEMNRIEYRSFVLRKNSPYTKAISYTISRLIDYGIVRRLKNKYFLKLTQLVNPQLDTVNLKQVYPIVAIWVIGLIMALLGLSIEIIVFRLSVIFAYPKTKPISFRRHKTIIINKRNIIHRKNNRF